MDFSKEGFGFVASLRRFFRLYHNAISKEISRESLFRIGVKRFCVLALSLLMFPLLIIWTHFGFWLDDIFFPQWKTVRVEAPCFIIGNARSGTTWFHRVLARDEKNFTGPKTWEIIFAQPVAYKYLFYKLGKIDNFLGGLGYKALKWIDTFCIRRSTVHPISLMEAEEDEWMMAHVCCCQLLALIFPLIDVFHPLIWFDKTLSLQSRRAIYQHYRRCIQRHLYAYRLLNTKSGKTEGRIDNSFPRYLSKNPTFTLRIDSIFDTFPDAQVVVMVRNPYDAIPSMVSYIQKCWATFAEPVEPRPFRSELQNMCSYHYTYPQEYRETHPHLGKQIAILHYEDCQSNLVDSVAMLYKKLFPIASQFHLDSPTMDLIRIEQEHTSKFVRSHAYSILDTCGLTETEFEERHAEAFNLYPRYKKLSK